MGAVLFVILHQKEQIHLCEKYLLQAQEKALKSLNQIQRKNAQAQHLRKMRAKADLRVLVSQGNPVLLAAALARQQQIILRQKLFSSQRALLISKKIAEIQFILGSYQRDLRQRRLFSSVLPKAKLQFTFSPPTSLSPDVLIPDNFKLRQKFRSEWTENIRNSFPEFAQLLPDSAFRIHSFCSVGVNSKGGGQWQATVLPDKWLSNF